MKKLCALFILCFVGIMQADQLSDAIVESDIEKVDALLSERKPSGREFIKYIDAAEQIIRLRRDNLVLGKADIKTKTPAKPYVFWMLGSCMSLIASAGTTCYSALHKNEIATGVATIATNASLVSLIASSIALIRCFEFEDIRKKYTDAITIKGMLFDSSELVAMDFAINH